MMLQPFAIPVVQPEPQRSVDSCNSHLTNHGSILFTQYVFFAYNGYMRGISPPSFLSINFAQGVVLTHGNFIANVAGTTLNEKFYPSDV